MVLSSRVEIAGWSMHAECTWLVCISSFDRLPEWSQGFVSSCLCTGSNLTNSISCTLSTADSRCWTFIKQQDQGASRKHFLNALLARWCSVSFECALSIKHCWARTRRLEFGWDIGRSQISWKETENQARRFKRFKWKQGYRYMHLQDDAFI